MIEDFSQRDQSLVAIIDSDEASSLSLSKTLEGAGFNVESFSNFVEAVDCFQWHLPDLIIAEYSVAGVSGIEFINELKERFVESTPPCFMLSEIESEAIVDTVYESGFAEYLHKPISSGILMAKLRRCLRQHESCEIRIQRSKIANYEIIREIGRGGMGIVYLARRGQEREVALKTLLSLEVDTDTLLRFRREIDILSSLDHPGLIPIYDAGRDEDLFFYTMKYIDGLSLDALMQQSQGQPSSATIIRFLFVMADALDYLHRQHISHRDLKPANILVSGKSDYILVDFGLAKNFIDWQITKRSQVVGTPQFMAPESITGQDIVDGRADIFALGMITLEWMAGRPVFQTQESFQIMWQITQDQFLKAKSIDGFPADLCELVDEMVTVDINKRLGSAFELLERCQDLFNRYC